MLASQINEKSEEMGSALSGTTPKRGEGKYPKRGGEMSVEKIIILEDWWRIG